MRSFADHADQQDVMAPVSVTRPAPARGTAMPAAIADAGRARRARHIARMSD